MRMAQSLNATLDAAAAGDQAAWRSLIDAFTDRVFGLIYRQCGDRELAEEITQATFVKVLDKVGEYKQTGQFESWLFRIAMNRLRDEMRRRKRQARAVDFAETPPETIGYGGACDGADPSGPLVEAEQHAALTAAIDRLPDADRKLIHMRYAGGMSYQQIAEALDQPLGTVLARGHRALKKLRTMLEDNANAA